MAEAAPSRVRTPKHSLCLHQGFSKSSISLPALPTPTGSAALGVQPNRLYNKPLLLRKTNPSMPGIKTFQGISCPAGPFLQPSEPLCKSPALPTAVQLRATPCSARGLPRVSLGSPP